MLNFVFTRTFFILLILSLFYSFGVAQNISNSLNSDSVLSNSQTNNKKTEIPFTLTYGFKAIDRKWYEPNGTGRQTGAFTFTAKLTPDLKVTIGNDNFVTGKNSDDERFLGFGNTTFGAEYTAKYENNLTTVKSHTPTTILKYSITAPTGNKEKGISTGRFDHSIQLALGRMFGKQYPINNEKFDKKTSLGAEFGVNFTGSKDSANYSKTGKLIVSMNRVIDNILTKKYTYSTQLEISNLSTKASARTTLTNRIFILFPNRENKDESTTLSIGLINGLSRGTQRIGFNVAITYKNLWNF